RRRDARRPLVGRERDECHGQLPPAPGPGEAPPPGPPPGTGTVPPGPSAPGSRVEGSSAPRFRPSGGDGSPAPPEGGFAPSGISATATAPAEAAWVTCAASSGGTATSTLVWS